MNIYCSECGQEMESKFHHMLPGNNDGGYVVEPCCNRVGDDYLEEYETEDILQFLKDTVHDNVFLLKDNDRLKEIKNALNECQNMMNKQS